MKLILWIASTGGMLKKREELRYIEFSTHEALSLERIVNLIVKYRAHEKCLVQLAQRFVEVKEAEESHSEVLVD